MDWQAWVTTWKWTDKVDHHSTDRLQETGAEDEQRRDFKPVMFTFGGWEQTVVNQTETVVNQTIFGNVRFGRRPVIGGVSRDVTSWFAYAEEWARQVC